MAGWLQTFEEFNGIRKLHVGGKVLSADDKAAERYSELCHNFLEQHYCCEPRFKKPMKLNSFGSIYNNSANKCTHVY